MAPTGALSGRARRTSHPQRVRHWYDFGCPYSYVAQHRTAVLRRLGLYPDLLPYSVHTETGASDAGQCRDSAGHRLLERAAADAGLTLRWPRRMPHTRDALRVAEWVRQYQPDRFDALYQRVFAAHFAQGDDIGDRDLIYALADHAGVDVAGVRAAMADGTAEAAVVTSESAARQRGITRPPAWLIGDRVMTDRPGGADFEQMVYQQFNMIVRLDRASSSTDPSRASPRSTRE
jgi:2-hydroxychromene-2-carboxylate isomerase